MIASSRVVEVSGKFDAKIFAKGNGRWLGGGMVEILAGGHAKTSRSSVVRALRECLPAGEQ